MKKLAAYKFTLLSAALILTALLLPAKTFSAIHAPPGLDKLVHMALFFIFTFAFDQEYRRASTANHRILVEIAIVLPFILLSEILQLFTRSRHFELLDMAADAVGAAVVMLAAGFYRHMDRSRGKKS